MQDWIKKISIHLLIMATWDKNKKIINNLECKVELVKVPNWKDSLCQKVIKFFSKILIMKENHYNFNPILMALIKNSFNFMQHIWKENHLQIKLITFSKKLDKKQIFNPTEEQLISRNWL